MNNLSALAERVFKTMYSIYFQQLKSIKSDINKEEVNFIDGLFWTKDETLSSESEVRIQNALEELKSKGYIRNYGDIVGPYAIIDPIDPR